MPQRFLYSIGVAGASVGVLSAVIAILVVPSLLALLGTADRRALDPPRPGGLRRVRRLVPARARGDAPPGRRRARPAPALLLAAAAPLLWTTLTGPSAEAVPPGQPSYDANSYVEAPLPARRHRGGHRHRRRRRRRRRSCAAFGRRIDAVDGVARGTPFVARLRAASPTPTSPSPSRRSRGASQDAVHAIRAPRPRRRRRRCSSPATRPRFIDQKQSLVDHLPLRRRRSSPLTTLVLLFLLTGSVLLPLKTLLMNAMTLGADARDRRPRLPGGLARRPASTTPGPAAVEVTSLVFLFAVIFGLATDYAVLVMARIKEQHDLGDEQRGGGRDRHRPHRPRDHRRGADDRRRLPRLRRQLGLLHEADRGRRWRSASCIDATIVRALLVPSLMRLLGDWNWWAPRAAAPLPARASASPRPDLSQSSAYLAGRRLRFAGTGDASSWI